LELSLGSVRNILFLSTWPILTLLSNRMAQLTENILMQKLVPKHFRKDVDTRAFEDKTGSYAGWTD